jgi:hypothetical protein
MHKLPDGDCIKLGHNRLSFIAKNEIQPSFDCPAVRLSSGYQIARFPDGICAVYDIYLSWLYSINGKRFYALI